MPDFDYYSACLGFSLSVLFCASQISFLLVASPLSKLPPPASSKQITPEASFWSFTAAPTFSALTSLPVLQLHPPKPQTVNLIHSPWNPPSRKKSTLSSHHLDLDPSSKSTL
ncbi:hypothetical protein ILYODFUR_006238 [Ilyodon furcidens]|uniref:ATP synthase F0 subunit 8 n=1 Tax=Ilyodon furcidens TaxID=33524 RepID=A0ABV0UF78_9TELE